MRTPVLFMVFNRPEPSARVFEAIARAKPSKLLVLADGPREGRSGEREQCEAVRRIVDRVDWDCEVLRNYSDVNLGCGRRVSSGLEWAFEECPELIILEDDTVPHPSFFRFCEEMLARYRDDERVMHISGNQLRSEQLRDVEHSYYFSQYDHIWGWATWRRAFRHYDFEMKHWPTLRETSWLADLFDDEPSALWWRSYLDVVHKADRSLYDSWDAQWAYTLWVQHGLSVTPTVNMVTNIGWGADATHTNSSDNPLGQLPLEEMTFPLAHPSHMVVNREADVAAFELACMGRTSRPQSHWLGSRIPKVVKKSLRELVPSRARV